ncbi:MULTISPECIES: type II toxin-antitoxin system HipA family toxin YjjJ [Serratia]|uniref:Transcriptional regulator n=1 Tax=Serratia marcescens TaxID=615 RepID=A0A2F0PAH8_SERMA|nr:MULTISPECIES: type II toxin-antitoxin system HipA family toxin YjjJ [Serratia]AUY13325.1 type II toxin-antitoxin system HipA family toxin [Serratia sp. SSNIH1]OCO81124.1 transcriptional regulator [Serratia marcescens]OCO81598.1 transcriptional regulator [Serratia marcescens]POU54913.1 type II toxin-antitoxin system HipA family toxin [Serratia sp. SSNIH4]POW39607.1 type II toxin-antitoxin system HipA family toxin [Serratia sp. SSNIH2]
MITVEQVLRHGPATARQLTEALGISQPTLSRRIRELAGAVLILGKGKATRYVLRRGIGGERQFPLYRIDERGKAHLFATLCPLYPADNCAVCDERSGEWQLYDGMPWYLNDLRPIGFLGRAWGKAAARELNLPEDVRRWDEGQRLLALCRYGEDMTGDLLPGADSYQRWLMRGTAVAITVEDKTERYAALSVQALAGELVGSSAGGEQPKFAAYAELAPGRRAHVLVKFSLAPTHVIAQRWSDLLIAESLALQTVAAAGLPAASAQILFGADRQCFLEVERFDRIGEEGRVAMVSLEALDAEFSGHANWVVAAERLLQQGVINHSVYQRIALYWAFGRLIANSDMHQGNLSFLRITQRPVMLAPLYDMLPMAFAPASSGNLRRDAVEIRLSNEVSGAVWRQAELLALEFWRRTAQHDDISEAFRTIAEQMLVQLQKLHERIQRLA